jgi:Protein of unknown function (DUF2848)
VPAVHLILERDAGREPIDVEIRRIINAGFTGRDQAAVQRHIAELRAHGVPCPDRTPVLYPKMAHLITGAREIEVLGPHTSGEAEFVLLVDRDRVLVASGSDHTDRELEKTTIEKAKLVAPNVLSNSVWELNDVREIWDDLELLSYTTAGGERTLYQRGRLSEMLTPDALLHLVRGRTDGDLAGMAIYSGTLPLIGGRLLNGERFEVELRDDRRGRTLRCDYRIAPIRWLREEGGISNRPDR